MNTADEQLIQVNGIDLCAECFGDRGDPAILLVHGGGSCMVAWDDELCRRLADGGRFVVRYDLRGAGRSTTGGRAFTLRDLVADAAGLLDALGVASAHVVGISLGGAVGQLLALDCPTRVATLTLVASTPGGPGHATPDLPPMSEALRASFAAEPPAPDWSDRAAVVDFLVEAERPFAATLDEAAARELAGQTFDHSVDLETSLTGAFSFDIGEPWRARLGAVTAPTLVLHGDQDPLFGLAHAHALAAEIPGAELLVLERTGHEHPPRRHWDRVASALLRHTAA